MPNYIVEVQPDQLQAVSVALKGLKLPLSSPAFNHIPVVIPESLVYRVKAIPGVVNVTPDQLSAIRAYTPMAVEAKFSKFIRLWASNPLTGPASAMWWAAMADAGKVRIPTSMSRQMVGADIAEAQGITGKGVKVAVLDTGTAYDALFQGAFTGGKSSMPGQPLGLDEVGHGTHCATTIGGRSFKSPRGLLKGVAVDAHVAAFKVLGGGLGLGFASSILGGLQNAMDWGADVISMSLGGPETDDYTTDPQCQVITQLTKKGIIVVVAAGNDGPGYGTIGLPGNCPDSLTVGAVDVDGALADFSSRGPTKAGFIKPDVVAPGVDILSTSGGYIAAMQASDGPPSLAAISGTSMATPHCTGVVALAIQYARSLGKVLTTDHIKEAMSIYGVPEKTNEIGWGLITYSILKRYIDENMSVISS
jgi:subtilisin family serine protease